MKATKILVPTDFSTGGQQALQTAVSLAREQQAELILVHVEEPPMAYGGGEFYYGLSEPNRDQLQRMLNEIQIDDSRVIVRRKLLVGAPATAIVNFARDEGVDFIVMPTHGRTGLGRLLMGSVAEEVVRKAACPVLTVKQPAAKPQPAKKEPAHVY